MPNPRQWLPGPDAVRLAIVPALVFIATVSDHQYLQDFWHHLARGRHMVEEGRLLNHDVFTCTVAGTEFRDVNWLTQVGYYLTYRIGGLPLVRAVNSLLLALAYWLLVLFCRHKSGSLPVAAAVGAFTFFATREVLTVRPQTLSLLLFVLVHWFLDGSRRRPWLLLLLPPLVGLWANLHGAFPAGLLLAGCYLGGAAWAAWREGALLRDGHVRGLAVCLAACLAATFVNPYGWGIYQYVGQTSGRASAREIAEWLPPGFELLITWFWAASLALVAATLAASWLRAGSRPAAAEVGLMLCFGVLAAGSVRMTVWWFFATAPFLAARLAGLAWAYRPARAAPPPEGPSVGSAVALGLILLATVAALPGPDRYNPLLQARPAGGTEDRLRAVQQELARYGGGGNIFTRFEWGEYLTWAASPDFKVFMDGRIEIYPDGVWREYVGVTTGGEGWESVLDRYGVDYLVLDGEYHRANGLLGRVERSAGWNKIFQIHNEVYVFARGPAAAGGTARASRGRRAR